MSNIHWHIQPHSISHGKGRIGFLHRVRMQSSSSRNIAGHQNNGTKCLLQLRLPEWSLWVRCIGWEEESNTCAVSEQF